MVDLMVLCNAHVESRVNEIRQDTNSTLEQLKETVAVVRESQERMWRAIDGMSKDVQELVQRDASTEGEEEIEPLPAVENPVEEEPISAKASAIAQPIPGKTILARSFFSISEEDVVSVKDCVTFGLPTHGSMEGMEAGGSGGHPTIPSSNLH